MNYNQYGGVESNHLYKINTSNSKQIHENSEKVSHNSFFALEELNSISLVESITKIQIVPFNPFTPLKRVKNSKRVTKKNRKNKIPYFNMVIDSGATRHCCNHLAMMNNIRNTNTNIMVGNGNIIKATKVGDIGIIKDILYIPEIRRTLFSLSYFLNQHDTSVKIFKNYCELLYKSKVIARGIKNNENLYIIRVYTRPISNKYTEKALLLTDSSELENLEYIL